MVISVEEEDTPCFTEPTSKEQCESSFGSYYSMNGDLDEPANGYDIEVEKVRSEDTSLVNYN